MKVNHFIITTLSF